MLPVLAFPAAGTDSRGGSFEYAVCLTRAGDALANRLPQRVRPALRSARPKAGVPDLDALAGVIEADRDDVMVTAVKRANRGEGIIVRLANFSGREGEVRLRCPSRMVRGAGLCDARERDTATLNVDAGVVVVPLSGSLATVRLIL
jgi:alpha-mannosidase